MTRIADIARVEDARERLRRAATLVDLGQSLPPGSRLALECFDMAAAISDGESAARWTPAIEEVLTGYCRVKRALEAWAAGKTESTLP